MADLIDRKELRDALYEADAVTMQGVKIINQFPAVNAAPLVRCRDCKYYYDYGVNRDYCCRRSKGEKQVFDVKFKADDFCSYGERKGGDE